MCSRKPEINTLKDEVLTMWFPLDNREARRRKGGLKIEMGAGVVAQCIKKLVSSPSILSLIPRTHRVEREHISQIALWLLYAHHSPCAPPINNK